MADPGATAAPALPTLRFGRGTGRLLVWGSVALVVSLALALSIVRPSTAMLLWNGSRSSAVGLYAVTPTKVLGVGDMAVAWAPPSARRLAAGRSYLPFGVPLVKRVAAVEGDRVCARGGLIFINGRPVAARRKHDPSGRPMPSWRGCIQLGRGDLFLLSSAGPLAFNGRYFGVTRASDLVGKARLLWPH